MRWLIRPVACVVVVLFLLWLTGCGGGTGTPSGSNVTTDAGVTAASQDGTLQVTPLQVPAGQVTAFPPLVIHGSDISKLDGAPGNNVLGDIVFANGTTASHDVWVMSFRPGNATRTVASSTNDERAPAMDPGGLFVYYQQVIGSKTEIYRSGLDGSHPENVTNYGGTTVNMMPTVSDDALYFVSNRAGNNEIYKMPIVDGGFGPVARLTTNTTDDVEPAVSPNGDALAWASNASGNYDIVIMDASGIYKLTSTADNDRHPTWSPDGTKIAFERTVSGNTDIYVVGTGGGSVTRLTTDLGLDKSPAWSPDGATIAFSSNRAGSNQIYTMRINGTSQNRITTSTNENVDPAWVSPASPVRTFIGAAGADGGFNPPFGATVLQAAIIGPADTLLPIGLRCLGGATNVVVTPPDATIYGGVVGVQFHTAGFITELTQDTGQGRAPVTYIRQSGTAEMIGNYNNVIILFQNGTNRPSVVLPFVTAAAVTASEGSSGAPGAQRTGGVITLSGPVLDVAAGKVCDSVTLDAATGKVTGSS